MNVYVFEISKHSKLKSETKLQKNCIFIISYYIDTFFSYCGVCHYVIRFLKLHFYLILYVWIFQKHEHSLKKTWYF